MSETETETPGEAEETTEAPETQGVDDGDDEGAALEETPDDDDDEGETEGDDEGDDEANASAGAPSDAEIERALDRIQGRGETYTKAIAEIAESVEQPLVRCPVCIPFVPGFVFDPGVIPLSPGQAEGAQVLLGLGGAPPLNQAPDAQTCPTCNGFGKVRTGSRVDGKGTLTCRECRGLGFVGEAANLTPAQVAGSEPLELALVPDPEVSQAEEDEWGTPRSHPDFGKMPHHRSGNWQEELDAYKRGLTAVEA